jgi:hypothetical protein
MSELSSQFYETAENLALAVQKFWKLLNVNQSANFQPKSTKDEGIVLAELIDSLAKVY